MTRRPIFKTLTTLQRSENVARKNHHHHTKNPTTHKNAEITKCYNNTIQDFIKKGLFDPALLMYRRMLCRGIFPDNFSYPYLLKACAHLNDLKAGKILHQSVIKTRFQSSLHSNNGLLNMYAKCNHMKDARKLFDKMRDKDDACYTAMLTGYVSCGHIRDVFIMFNEMLINGIDPSVETMTTIVRGCSKTGTLKNGQQIHGYLLRKGYSADLFLGGCMLNMYCKCGFIEFARKVFDEMPERNSEAWNSIVAGYVQDGYHDDALDGLRQMQMEGFKTSEFVLSSVLSSCARHGVLSPGREIHGYAIRNWFDKSVFVGNSLIDMYGKCGCVGLAKSVFDVMCSRDVGTWTAMISCYGIHGYGSEAVELYSKMRDARIKTNEVTITAILSACSHAGLIDQGLRIFQDIKKGDSDALKYRHYACIVDLFGRAGHLKEALDFINSMPIAPDASVWGTLLASCIQHKNVDLAEFAADRYLRFEERNAGFYVLISNMYAKLGRWDDVKKVRLLMQKLRLEKDYPARPSW